MRKAKLLEGRLNAQERLGQVLVDVIGEGSQRRDVDHLRGVLERPIQPLAEQLVDAGQKRGERLP